MRVEWELAKERRLSWRNLWAWASDSSGRSGVAGTGQLSVRREEGWESEVFTGIVRPCPPGEDLQQGKKASIFGRACL